jgi:hypothetical protein
MWLKQSMKAASFPEQLAEKHVFSFSFATACTKGRAYTSVFSEVLAFA